MPQPTSFNNLLNRMQRFEYKFYGRCGATAAEVSQYIVFYMFLRHMAVFFAAIKAHLSVAAYRPSSLSFHICYGYKTD